jgi:hypothetical protein
VLFTGGGVDNVPGRHPHRFPVVGLYLAGPGGDIENLAVGMSVPIGARTGLEQNPESVEATVRGRRQRAEVDLAREVLVAGSDPTDVFCRSVFH